MAARKMNMFEKIANMLGVLYRHQKSQFPRRFALLKGVAQKELAPPTQAEWPAIKADFNKVLSTIQSGAYKNYTIRETLVYTAVAIEIVCWFFVGEMIGRRYIPGYLVPADFVSKETRKKAKELEAAENCH